MRKPTAGIAAALSFFLTTAALPAAFEASVKNEKGAPVADAVVSLVPSTGPAPAFEGESFAVMDQKGMEFVPKVLPVRTGTRVRFPNSDNILHHVYSFSSPKPFELPLYKGKTVDPVLFDKPGTVVLGCNIHDWMLGYILIVDTPYFSKTGGDGLAILRDVPPGEYKAYLWHYGLKDLKKMEAVPVKVIEAGNRTLELKVRLYPKRITGRMPQTHGGTGY